eukprot:3525355-Karenia_brevis.AAC.1
MGVPSLVGRLHRELRTRSMVLFGLLKLRSMDSATLAGASSKKARIGPDVELLVGQQEVAAEVSIANTFQYILALQIYCWTLAWAGSFTV